MGKNNLHNISNITSHRWTVPYLARYIIFLIILGIRHLSEEIMFLYKEWGIYPPNKFYYARNKTSNRRNYVIIPWMRHLSLEIMLLCQEWGIYSKKLCHEMWHSSQEMMLLRQEWGIYADKWCYYARNKAFPSRNYNNKLKRKPKCYNSPHIDHQRDRLQGHSTETCSAECDYTWKTVVDNQMCQQIGSPWCSQMALHSDMLL